MYFCKLHDQAAKVKTQRDRHMFSVRSSNALETKSSSAGQDSFERKKSLMCRRISQRSWLKVAPGGGAQILCWQTNLLPIYLIHNPIYPHPHPHPHPQSHLSHPHIRQTVFRECWSIEACVYICKGLFCLCMNCHISQLQLQLHCLFDSCVCLFAWHHSRATVFFWDKSGQDQ